MLYFLLLMSTIFIFQCRGIEGTCMIESRPITLNQREEVKKLILQIAYDTWELQKPFEFANEIYQSDEFVDVDNLDAFYFDNKGIFLVLMDEKKIVGTGAIKRLDDITCELKRMFLQSAYQGRGLGSNLLNELIDFAQAQGYKKIQLNIWQPQKQQAAMHLYKKFGFYEVESYQKENFIGQIFMEKIIN